MSSQQTDNNPIPITTTNNNNDNIAPTNSTNIITNTTGNGNNNNNDDNNNNNNNNKNNDDSTTTNTSTNKPRKRFIIPSASQALKKSDLSMVEINAKLKQAEDLQKSNAIILTPKSVTMTTSAPSIPTPTTVSTPLSTSTLPSSTINTTPVQQRIAIPSILAKRPVNTSPSPLSTSPTSTSASTSQTPYYSPSFVKNPTAPAPLNKPIGLSLPMRPSLPKKPANYQSSSTYSTSTTTTTPTTTTPNYQHIDKIYANSKQRGSLMMNSFSKNIIIEYSELQYPDFIINSNTLVFYLALKTHRDNPNLIQDRIKGISTLMNHSDQFTLRLLLVFSDLSDSDNCETFINELNLIAIRLQFTLIVCWSQIEAAKYLEAFKTFYNRAPDPIKARTQPIELGGKSKNEEVLTSIKSINKTDASTLLKNFQTMQQIFTCPKDTLSKLPGFGPVKIQRFYNTIHQPFKTKPSLKTTTTTTITNTNSNTNTNQNQDQNQNINTNNNSNNNNIINNINFNNDENEVDEDPLNFSFDFGGDGDSEK
ncbi:hypothetical protein ACTA71_003963 [Dictyostelium dimigraforme]